MFTEEFYTGYDWKSLYGIDQRMRELTGLFLNGKNEPAGRAEYKALADIRRQTLFGCHNIPTRRVHH